jgi:hypothetical protein
MAAVLLAAGTSVCSAAGSRRRSTRPTGRLGLSANLCGRIALKLVRDIALLLIPRIAIFEVIGGPLLGGILKRYPPMPSPSVSGWVRSVTTPLILRSLTRADIDKGHSNRLVTVSHFGPRRPPDCYQNIGAITWLELPHKNSLY